jgi:hypothetical protein
MKMTRKGGSSLPDPFDVGTSRLNLSDWYNDHHDSDEVDELESVNPLILPIHDELCLLLFPHWTSAQAPSSTIASNLGLDPLCPGTRGGCLILH